MKRKLTTLILLTVVCTSLWSCKKNDPAINSAQERTFNKVSGNAPGESSPGTVQSAPTIPDIVYLHKVSEGEYNVNLFFGALIRFGSLAIPLNPESQTITQVKIHEDTWNTIAIPLVGGSNIYSLTPPTYANPPSFSYDRNVVTMTQSYCQAIKEESLCANWTTTTQTRMLIKVLNPHGLINSELVLISANYLNTGPVILPDVEE